MSIRTCRACRGASVVISRGAIGQQHKDWSRLLTAAVVFMSVLIAACKVDPFTISGATAGDGGSGVEDAADPLAVDAGGVTYDGGVQFDSGIADAMFEAPDACGTAQEVCNGIDDDCDTEVDEGFNTQADPANCGQCGNACSRPNMAGTCGAGVCQYACLPGWVDLNGEPDDGCEYLCSPTNGGMEACDFSDNNCDGEIDEGFNLDSDVDNCGSCGRACVTLHADPVCVDGLCEHSGCHDMFNDLIDEVPGCEYECPQWPTGAELCDVLDNDCDGVIDESPIAGLGEPCVPVGFEAFGDNGECSAGHTACSYGTPVCEGYVGPSGEICDQLDNDCDELVDEGFDKANDPRHCGDTCRVCSFANAVAGCSAGSCTIAGCNAGFVDADGELANGCEYECTASGPEMCDGRDNDCDTLTDGDDPDMPVPPNFCLGNGACAGVTPGCTAGPCGGQVSWRCIYGGQSEADSCGALPLQEQLCDGIDGDCDGQVDELYPLAGTVCDDGGLGECLGTGAYICNSAKDGVQCNITDPGASSTGVEVACDNRDEDCNGVPDDGAPDTMVRVTHSGLDFWIDAYEASRPDATTVAAGEASHRACSNSGVVPWRSVSWLAASAACADAGKRLCTEVEWMAACAGSLDQAYPYGDVYEPEACNGNDYDHDCAGQDEDICLPSGTSYGCPAPGSSQCVSEAGAYDLSGNLKEWTASVVTSAPPTFRILGGAYDSVAGGLSCDYDFVSGSEIFYFENLGFRCCMDVTP